MDQDELYKAIKEAEKDVGYAVPVPAKPEPKRCVLARLLSALRLRRGRETPRIHAW